MVTGLEQPLVLRRSGIPVDTTYVNDINALIDETLDLARATGLNKSSFYHHFSGKEQLLSLGVNRALDAPCSATAAPHRTAIDVYRARSAIDPRCAVGPLCW